MERLHSAQPSKSRSPGPAAYRLRSEFDVAETRGITLGGRYTTLREMGGPTPGPGPAAYTPWKKPGSGYLEVQVERFGRRFRVKIPDNEHLAPEKARESRACDAHGRVFKGSTKEQVSQKPQKNTSESVQTREKPRAKSAQRGVDLKQRYTHDDAQKHEKTRSLSATASRRNYESYAQDQAKKQHLERKLATERVQSRKRAKSAGVNCRSTPGPADHADLRYSPSGRPICIGPKPRAPRRAKEEEKEPVPKEPITAGERMLQRPAQSNPRKLAR